MLILHGKIHISVNSTNICFLQIYTHTQFVSNIYIIKLVSINQKIKQDLINIITIFKNYVSMTNLIKKIIKRIGCDLELTQSANEILNTLAVSFSSDLI